MLTTSFAYFLLGLAIISEVVASSLLSKAEGFTNFIYSIIVLILFFISFYLLSIVVKVIPISIAYAIWAGIGITLTAIIGCIFFKQSLDLPAFIGIGLIVLGVIIINMFSQFTGH